MNINNRYGALMKASIQLEILNTKAKKKIEEDEEIRVCINNKLFCIQKDLEYEEQARKEAETNQRSRNTFPGDWACGHRYGP